MISVEKAQALIGQHIPPLSEETISLSKALGTVIARDIRSPIALPSFDNSAMDGFVLRARDTRSASPRDPARLKIEGVVKAGGTARLSLSSGETFRIMTGALLPQGADTVIPKEEAVTQNGFLVICTPPQKGSNVRCRGEEIKKGETILRKYARIHPAAIGLLAQAGIHQVKVFRKPRVSLITTGTELVKPGSRLACGKIFNSNSFMISSALVQMGIPPLRVVTVKDELQYIRKVFRRALSTSDVVIIVGGVSVGDYDYVRDVLSAMNVRSIFWKVRQKPGKPVYFGKRAKTLIFGLPGNPAGAFTCFYEYVYPCLGLMMGLRNPHLTAESLPLARPVRADAEKLLFLKGKISFDGAGKTVLALRRQASHMLSSLAESNCFVLIPPRKGLVRRGTKVLTHVIPL